VEIDRDAGRTVLLMEDVSERVAAAQEREALLAVAEQARLEAEGANRAKSEFLAVMSHELRTPLNAIGGYAQLFELGIRGPITDQQRRDLERIQRSQTYLLSLINDVLNFAKIESGHLTVDLEDVLVNDLLNGTSDFVRPQLRERGLAFTTRLCEPSVRVRADREKVQQILLNLLSNALKFTPSGGEITLSCTMRAGAVVVSVCDTGRGIAAEKPASIFEPFVQVVSAFHLSGVVARRSVVGIRGGSERLDRPAWRPVNLRTPPAADAHALSQLASMPGRCRATQTRLTTQHAAATAERRPSENRDWSTLADRHSPWGRRGPTAFGVGTRAAHGRRCPRA
jgi:hypothetical protein